MKKLFTLALIGLSLTAQARLGYNLEQLKSKYGRVIKQDGTKDFYAVSFMKKGIGISILMFEGKAVTISYTGLSRSLAMKMIAAHEIEGVNESKLSREVVGGVSPRYDEVILCRYYSSNEHLFLALSESSLRAQDAENAEQAEGF